MQQQQQPQQYDISDIPEQLLKSLASNCTVEVDELRREAYRLLIWRGEDVWRQLKKEGSLSKNRIEFWKEQVAWGKAWEKSGT